MHIFLYRVFDLVTYSILLVDTIAQFKCIRSAKQITREGGEFSVWGCVLTLRGDYLYWSSGYRVGPMNSRPCVCPSARVCVCVRSDNSTFAKETQILLNHLRFNANAWHCVEINTWSVN